MSTKPKAKRSEASSEHRILASTADHFVVYRPRLYGLPNSLAIVRRTDGHCKSVLGGAARERDDFIRSLRTYTPERLIEIMLQYVYSEVEWQPLYNSRYAKIAGTPADDLAA